MPSPKSPYLRYTVPSGSLLISLFGYFFKKDLELAVSPVMDLIPFGLVSIGLACAICGQLYADWTNPHSRLRVKVKEWRRCFDIKGPYPSHDIINGQEYFLITLRLKFVKPVQNGDFLLKIYGCLANGQPRQTFTISLDKSRHIAIDEEMQVILAVVPHRTAVAENPWWGSYDILPENRQAIPHGSKNVVGICLRDGRKYQEHRVFIEIPQKDGNTFGKVFMIDESEDVFLIS